MQFANWNRLGTYQANELTFYSQEMVPSSGDSNQHQNVIATTLHAKLGCCICIYVCLQLVRTTCKFSAPTSLWSQQERLAAEEHDNELVLELGR
jgi:hypothetical protein